MIAIICKLLLHGDGGVHTNIHNFGFSLVVWFFFCALGTPYTECRFRNLPFCIQWGDNNSSENVEQEISSDCPKWRRAQLNNASFWLAAMGPGLP